MEEGGEIVSISMLKALGALLHCSEFRGREGDST
jgi:hypothetical protein